MHGYLPFVRLLVATILLCGHRVLAQTATVEPSSITAAIATAVASGMESEEEANLHKDDILRKMQRDAVTAGKADWGYWGTDPARYSTWTSHSNRLIPIYTFGITLQSLRAEGSVYCSEDRIKSLYGVLPEKTLVEKASYFDQTDVYRLQQQAVAQGKTQIILVVFDGMDWNTTYNAALYQAGKLSYREGRGNVLHFQKYRGAETDFGFFVTSAKMGDCKIDVNAQTVLDGNRPATGGYDPQRGSAQPWAEALQKSYLIGLDRTLPHTVTDSASSATSMTSGIKTYNAAINMTTAGELVEPIGRQLQREKGFSVGVVTSVPISHATPAAAYANNVSRDDYQDLTRDLIGLPSVAHKHQSLSGVDVLIVQVGASWQRQMQSKATTSFPATPTMMKAISRRCLSAKAVHMWWSNARQENRAPKRCARQPSQRSRASIAYWACSGTRRDICHSAPRTVDSIPRST